MRARHASATITATARTTARATARSALARRAALAALALSATFASTWAADARAELRESVERVAGAWRAVGGVVMVDRTRFLNDDQTVVVVLPPLPEGECTTVAMLGARGLSFHARVAGAGRTPDAADRDAPQRIPSEAGALSFEQCGGAPPSHFLVTSDSGRGALETVVARSVKPLPGLRAVLPERAGGGWLASSEPGLLPPMPAPDRRAELAEARARRDGASVATRTTWPSGLNGTGAAQETLGPGCHTLTLFALDPRAAHPSRRGRLDLDAEMHDEADDRLIARDRTDAPDAQLDLCVGDARRVTIVFAGSPPGSPVLVAHFVWPLPAHLPTPWGADMQARMAHVLLARHVVSLPEDPVALAQGGSGLTPVPLTVEPGACYLSVVALAQSVARTVGLRVHAGAREAFDDRGVDDDGAAVAFCAGDLRQVVVEVEARGAPLLVWGLALYKLQSGVWRVPS